MSNDAPNPKPPVVPDHELIRCVGRGSYGEVWLARNVIGTFRAVKIVLRSRFDHDRPAEREFDGLQAYEPISRTHPGLTSVLHIGKRPDGFYYVMELADDQHSGQTIDPRNYHARTLGSEIVRCGRLPARECVRLGLQVGDALEHLHRHGLVHRDIKPSNIIFVNGQPKLADVGLVTPIRDQTTLVGTAGYIPPEGPGSPVADLFSLGRVLYEMSMGKDARQFPELPTQLRDLEETPLLLQLNSVIVKCCDPNPRQRFQNASELHAALAALQGRQGRLPITTAASAPPSGGPPKGPVRIAILNCADSPISRRLAAFLQERLRSRGKEVFFDDQTYPSVGWARTLERQVQEASVVAALISEASWRNERLAYGIELAHQARSQEARGPRLVVIRVRAADSLSSFFRVAFEAATQLRWQDPDDDERIVGELDDILTATSGAPRV